MPALVTYVDVVGADIVAVGKILGRVPALPGRHPINDPIALAMIERLGVRFLKWDGAAIVTKTRAELDADVVAAKVAASDREAASIHSETVRDMVNTRLVAIGQPAITEDEEATRRLAIRNGE